MRPHLLKVAGLPDTLTQQLHEHFIVEDLGPNPEPDKLRAVATSSRIARSATSSVRTPGVCVRFARCARADASATPS